MRTIILCPSLLTHFTQHDTHHVHPSINQFNEFMFPIGCVIVHCVDVSHFLYYFIFSRALRFTDYGYCEYH